MRRAQESSTREIAPARGGHRQFILIGLCTLFVAAVLWAANLDPFALWKYVGAQLTRKRAIASRSSSDDAPIAAVQPPPIGTDSSVSKRRIPLILRGTILGQNAYEGFAYIGVSAFSPQTYSAGAVLANGARLLEIHKNYVVLARAGHTARLYVVGRTPPDYVQSALSPLATVGGGSQEPPSTQPTSQDPLGNIIRAAPVFSGSGGAIGGVIVYSGRHAKAFARLGLHEGDVITAVDGTALTSQQMAIDALSPLLKGAALVATVRRGAHLQTISLDGAVLQ